MVYKPNLLVSGISWPYRTMAKKKCKTRIKSLFCFRSKTYNTKQPTVGNVIELCPFDTLIVTRQMVHFNGNYQWGNLFPVHLVRFFSLKQRKRKKNRERGKREESGR